MTTIKDHAKVGLNTRNLSPQLKEFQTDYLEANTTEADWFHHNRK